MTTPFLTAVSSCPIPLLAKVNLSPVVLSRLV